MASSSSNGCRICSSSSHKSKQCPRTQCGTCGGKGHVSSICTSHTSGGPLCFRCGLPGHRSSNCWGYSTGHCANCNGVRHSEDECASLVLNPICPNCLKNHYARDCPDGKLSGHSLGTCHFCAVPGHNAPDCPQRRRE
ncbi:hypothetical protein VPH35_118846 [Triticum aestivum]